MCRGFDTSLAEDYGGRPCNPRYRDTELEPANCSPQVFRYIVFALLDFDAFEKIEKFYVSITAITTVYI